MPGTLFSFDLASSHYSREAESFYLGIAKYRGNKQAAAHVDGNFKVAQRVSAPLPEHPWQHVGDRAATILRATYMQALASFKPLALGTKLPEDSRFYLIEETDFEDAKGGMVTWTRVYATVPQDHDQLESFAQPYQYVFPLRPPALQDKVFKVGSKVRREFFLENEISKYPILQAARLDLFGEYNGRPLILTRGDTDFTLVLGNLFVTTDKEIVAEDSKVEAWHYPIYCRETRYVPGPTLAMWGNEYTALDLP